MSVTSSDTVSPHWCNIPPAEIFSRVRRCTIEDLYVFLDKLLATATEFKKDSLLDVFSITCAMQLERLTSLTYSTLRSWAISLSLISPQFPLCPDMRLHILSLICQHYFGPYVYRCLRSIPPRLQSELVPPELQYLFEIPDNVVREALFKIPTKQMRNILKVKHPLHGVSKVHAHNSVVSQCFEYLLTRRAEVCSSTLPQLQDDFLSLSPHLPLPSSSLRQLAFDVLTQEFGENIVSLLSQPRLVKDNLSWPNIVPEHVKLACLHRHWKNSIWTPPRPCSVCDRAVYGNSVTTLDCTSAQFNSLPWHILQCKDEFLNTHFDFNYNIPILSQCILSTKGIHHNDSGVFVDVCSDCIGPLSNGTLPKFALANNLFRGSLPPEFHDLTWVEEMVCALSKPTAFIARLYGSSDPKNPRYLKGNTCAHEMNVSSTASVLPRTPADVNGNISVVFIGTSPFKSAGLRSIFFIRKRKVWSFLCWLKQNNPLYADVTLDADILHLYPEAGILPGLEDRVISSTLDAAALFNDETAGYTDHPSDLTADSSTCDPDKPLILLDKLGVVDPDGACIPGRMLSAVAIKNLIPGSPNNPDLLISNSSAAVSEYNNPALFPAMYPTLFPYGIGGFDDNTREKPISFIARANALLDCPDRAVRYHWSFLFTAINIYQRHQAHLHTHITVNGDNFDSLARKISSISSQSLLKLSDRIRDEGAAGDLSPEEKNAFALLREVNTISNKIPGSQGSMLKMRSSVFGQVAAFNLHPLYFTMNPCPQHSPIFQLMWGDITVDLTTRYPKLVPSTERALRLAQDPVAAADFFEFSYRRIFEDLFGWDFDLHRSKADGGILGHVSCFAGTIEVNGRGGLHAHFLINLRGSLNPTDLHDALSNNPEYQNRYFSFFEDTIQHHLPQVTVAQNSSEPRTERPPKPPEPSMKDSNPIQYDEDLRVFYQELSEEEIKRCGESFQRHQCQKVCHKYGNDNKCRFKFPHDLVERSWYDEDNKAVVFIVKDSTVNFHNRYILVFCRHNHDLKCILSGRAARAAIIYITDYITKMDMRTYQVLSLLSRAVLENETNPDSAETEQQNAKRVLHKCLTQFSRKREIHGQTAARYLRGLGDVILSHPSAPMLSGMMMSYVMRTYKVSIPETDFSDDEDDDGSDAPQKHPSSPDFEPEQLSITIDKSGNVFHVDQVIDYLYRDLALKDLCFYMFTHAIRKRSKKGQAKTPTRAGSHPRFRLLQGHPQYLTHELRLEGSISHDPSTWSSIPRMIGCTAPRKTDTPRYYWFVLAHFKPFSSSNPLLQPQDCNNIDAFFHLYTLSDVAQRVTANWEELCNCEDEREAERMRKDDRVSRESKLKSMESTFGLNDSEDLPLVQAKTFTSFAEDMNIIDSIERLRNAGFFNYSLQPGTTSSDSPLMPENVSRTINLNFSTLRKLWDTELKQASDAIASRRRNATDLSAQSEIDRVRDTSATVPTTIRSAELAHLPIRPTLSNTLDQGSIPLQTPKEIIENIGIQNKLNEQQWIAYRLISNAFIEKLTSSQDKNAVSPSPLRLFLTGPGGTGKTHVVNTVKQVMAYYGCEDRIRFLAPTGSAATLIEGRTIHSGLSIVINNKNIDTGSLTSKDLPVLELSVKNKLAVRKEWKNVFIVFIDEISMVGLYLLAQIDRALRYGKEVFDEYFGGLIVILSGDLYQFNPILDKAVYTEIKSHAAVTDRELMTRLGKLAWNSITDVVELHRQQRMIEDPIYSDAVRRLRKAECTEEDVALFNTRVMKGSHSSSGVDLSSAQYGSAIAIVPTNNLRRAINLEKAKSLTNCNTNIDLIQCEAFDEIGTTGRALSSEGGLSSERDMLLRTEFKSSSRQIPPGFIHIYIGMPVVLKEKNISTELRLTNGACGYVHHYILRNDMGSRKVLQTVFVHFPDSPVQLSHLPKGVVPIPAITTRFRHQTRKEDGSLTTIIIRRHQVPIQPAFAATAHFAQGKTMGNITASFGKGGAHAYVCASRPTTRFGLVLTERTTLKNLNTPRPRSLLKESERLAVIEHNTLVKHGYLKAPYKNLLPCYSKPTARIIYRTDETDKYDERRADIEDPSKIEDPAHNSSQKSHVKAHKRPRAPNLPRPRKSLKVSRHSAATNGNASSTYVISQPSIPQYVPGVQWSTDWSCAYDAFVMTLFSACIASPAIAFPSFLALNNLTLHLEHSLVDLLHNSTTASFNQFRDVLRNLLSASDPMSFPRHGQNAIAVTLLLERVLNSPNISLQIHISPRCLTCDIYSFNVNSHTENTQLRTLLHPSQSDTVQQGPLLLSSWLSRTSHSSPSLTSAIAEHNTQCIGRTALTISFLNPPPFLFFEVQALQHLPLLADIKLQFPSSFGLCSYHLCSIIYAGNNHFVTALLLNDSIWIHDGQINSGTCSAIPNLVISQLQFIDPANLISDRTANIFFYVRTQ